MGWSWRKRDSGGRQPVWALNEAADRKRLRLRCWELTGPSDTAVQTGCTRTIRPKLGSKERGKSEVAIPWQPTRGINDLVNVGSNEHSARECFPRSTKECMMRFSIGLKQSYILRSSKDSAVLKDKACCLCGICSALQNDANRKLSQRCRTYWDTL